jgi:DNA repair exonuclease SbcCD ATPase subunit
MAEKTAKDFNHFNDALDETAKSAKNVNSTFEEVYGELQPLTTRLGEAEDRLYELALAGDTTSKEYQELLEKVGQYRKVQIETDLAVDGAATTMTQKLGSALTGVTSGFATTQGALALFGSENEALEKSLLKVQAALAIQQGIDGLRTSYKELGGVTGIATSAQKAFNLVLKANPIVLIVSGIAAAVAALASFTDVLDPVIDGLKQFGDFLGITNFEEDKLAAERRKRAEEERQRIEAERKQREQAFNQSQSQYDREIALLEAQGKSTVELTKQKIEASIAYQKEKIKEIQLELKGLKVAEDAFQGQSAFEKMARANAKKSREEREAEILELNNNISDSENQLKINVINNNKKKAASYKENNAREIEDLENDLLQDGLEKELKINEVKFRRLREDAEKNTKLTRDERKKIIDLYDKQELAQQKVINQKYIDLEKQKNAKIDEEKAKANKERIDKEDALFQLELSLMKDRQMAEIIALTQQYDKKFALANGNAELERQLTEQQEADIAAIQDKYRKEKEAKEEKADKEKAERQQAQIDLAVQGLQLVAGFAELFAGDDEKRQKKAFQIKKAADIASATVDGYRAVLSTYAQTPGGPVLKGIAAGIAGGFASLQIANIARQQFEGGGGVGGDFSADTGGGAGEVQAPEFNVVGDSSVNQLAQLQQTPTQAFVVSGEVTSAQALDRNRVTNATL